MANYLRFAVSMPEAVGVSATVAMTGGTIAAANYSFCVVAWYGDGDESKLNNMGYDAISGGTGRIAAVAATGATSKIVLIWTAPQRGGKTAPDLHHYAIYYQLESKAGNTYNLALPGTKIAVKGYSDGNIPPWITTATMLDEASVYTSVAATVRKSDGTVDSYWVEGDHRASFGPGAANVTISGSTGGTDDGAKTVVWSDLAYGIGGGNASVGVYTVIKVSQAVTNGIAATLNYRQGPLTIYQLGVSGGLTDVDGYHSWGMTTTSAISLVPICHMQPTCRNQYYMGYDGIISPASYGQDVVFTHLEITISAVSCTSWGWNTLIHMMRQGVRFQVDDFNDRAGVGTGMAGDGCVGKYYGYVAHMSYLGNTGKNRDNTFSLVLQVEREVSG